MCNLQFVFVTVQRCTLYIRWILLSHTTTVIHTIIHHHVYASLPCISTHYCTIHELYITHSLLFSTVLIIYIVLVPSFSAPKYERRRVCRRHEMMISFGGQRSTSERERVASARRADLSLARLNLNGRAPVKTMSKNSISILSRNKDPGFHPSPGVSRSRKRTTRASKHCARNSKRCRTINALFPSRNPLVHARAAFLLAAAVRWI